MKDRTTRFFRRYWLAFAIVIVFVAMWVGLWDIRYRRGRVHGGRVISVGAAPKIREHPGVIRLSRTAARAGMVVMIPQLYYPFHENVLPEDVQGLVTALGMHVEGRQTRSPSPLQKA